jgi:large subunit ribosomal protein L5
MKVKKGDTVVVIAGKDKGAKGKVIAAYPRLDKVLVEGVNRVKKHTRIRTTQRGAKTGGIVTQEAPIHVSNVMVVDRTASRPASATGRRRTARRSASRAAPVRTCDDDRTVRRLPALKERYRRGVAGKLREQFATATRCRCRGWSRSSVNMGVGEAARDAKLIDGAVRDLTTITGRSRRSPRHQVHRAVQAARGHADRRQGDPARRPDVGVPGPAAVDRAAPYPRLPRPRRAQARRQRQLHVRLTEQSVFHEIDQDRIDRPRGMDITVVTTAKTDDEGRALLKLLGFPVQES